MDMAELDAMSHVAASPMVMVGIPCYNEEVAIGSLVLRASQYADQVVVIDDGSTDKTAEVARLAGARVLVLDRVVHFGLNGDVSITDTQSGFRAFSVKTAPFFKFNSDERDRQRDAHGRSKRPAADQGSERRRPLRRGALL